VATLTERKLKKKHKKVEKKAAKAKKKDEKKRSIKSMVDCLCQVPTVASAQEDSSSDTK
jgi:hypothetical protein